MVHENSMITCEVNKCGSNTAKSCSYNITRTEIEIGGSIISF